MVFEETAIRSMAVDSVEAGVGNFVLTDSMALCALGDGNRTIRNSINAITRDDVTVSTRSNVDAPTMNSVDCVISNLCGIRSGKDTPSLGCLR